MSGPVQGVGYGGLDPRERRGAGQVSDAAIGDGLEKVDGRVRLKLDPKSALSITPRGELSVEQAEQGAAGVSPFDVFFRDVLQSGVETTGATLEDVIDAEVELLKRKSQASGYPSLDATIHVPGAELGTSYGAGGTKVLTDTNPPSWNTAPPSSLPLHASAHQHGGTDEVATTTPGADDIPKALGTGKLSAGWVSEVLGLVDLTDVAAVTGTGTTAVLSGAPVFTGAPTVPDFTNAQHDHSSAAEGGVLAAAPPGLHATTHQHGGTDEVAVVDAAVNAIPKADPVSGALRRSWIAEVMPATDLSDVSATTGTGSTIVFNNTPTLLTPTVADFTNATHDHSSTAEGGTLAAATPAAHAASHQHGGSDEVATATPGANAIPKADGSNKLAAGWVSEVLAIADLSDATAKTGTGTVVVMDTSPTIVTPTIASFANATHDHSNAAGGAQIPTAGIADDAVTYAKIQNVTDARVLGRAAGSSGDVQELSAGSGITIAAGTISATGSGGTVTSVSGTTPISVATGTTTPVISLDTDGVTFAFMQEIATDRLIGRDTAATGNPEELTVTGGVEFTGAGGIQRSALTGDVTATAGSNATTIPNDTVTFAKMQNVTTARVLGRTTAGSGDVEELSAGTGITIAAGTISASGGAGTVTNVTGTAPISVATGTTTPVVSLDNDGVTFAKMQNIATDRLIGRDTAATGDPEEISLGVSLEFSGSASIQRAALTGDVTAAANGNATTIANDAVTYAKIQNMTTARVLGRTTAASGDVEELSAGTGIAISGGTISATGGVAPAAHAASHQHGGSDEVAVAIPAANGIPKADGTGKLSAGWISETLALSGLSDVTAKTGTGTIVVMDTSPTIVTPVIASFVTAQHNHSSAATGGAIVAASTTVAGVIEISTDGEASATTAVVGTDNRLLTLIDTSQRSVRSVLSSPGVGVPFVAATAYFVYLGRVTKTTTFGFVRWLIRSAASGAQVAECGFFSSPVAPSRAGQTLTKLAATGTLSNLTVTGPASNSTTLAASIPAGTHLWSGIRMNMGTSQGSAYGLLQDQGQGRVLSTAGAGTLTAGTTFVGALITDTGIALCAGIEATLD